MSDEKELSAQVRDWIREAPVQDDLIQVRLNLEAGQPAFICQECMDSFRWIGGAWACRHCGFRFQPVEGLRLIRRARARLDVLDARLVEKFGLDPDPMALPSTAQAEAEDQPPARVKRPGFIARLFKRRS